MANLSNSSLSGWLGFDRTNLPTIHPCQHVDDTGETAVLSPASCAQVCNDSLSLFWPPTDDPPTNNLVTCGLWITLMAQYTFLGPNKDLQYEPAENMDSLLSSFEGTGLNESDVQHLPSYSDTISDCLGRIYVNVKRFSFADDGRVASACTRDELFPLASLETDVPSYNLSDDAFHPTIIALRDCLDATCSPLTLNPDLAGIGVSLIGAANRHGNAE